MKNNVNDYTNEIIKDDKLREIKSLCLLYLANKENLSAVQDNVIMSSMYYINDLYEEIHNLKSNLKIKPYSSPFKELYKNLDSLIINEFTCISNKPLYEEFVKDIFYLSEQLGFVWGILKVILQERDLFEE